MRNAASPIPLAGFPVVHSEKLGNQHFVFTILLVFLLHVSAFVAWSFSPKQQIRELPIRLLNIRLGDGDELALETPQPQLPTNAPQVEAMIEKAAMDVAAPKASENNEIRQYVREVSVPKPKKSGGAKDGARDAEIMSRYTQLISLWIQKFKVYPEEARLQGLKGSTVVRIRIDRRGTINYYALERSTGIILLDQAAIDMIRRANPVPAVPSDYPAGESFEFLIPVNFSLI